MEDQFFRKVIDHFKTHQTKLLEVKVLDTLMRAELRTWVFLITTHTHYVDGWTLGLDMHRQFLASQVLEIGELADITTKLGAAKLAVISQLSHSPPHNLLVSVLIKTPMRELAVLNEVSEHLVDILQEGSLDAAVWTEHAGLLSFLGGYI